MSELNAVLRTQERDDVEVHDVTQELAKLWKDLGGNRRASRAKAREALITHYAPLVTQVAVRMTDASPGAFFAKAMARISASSQLPSFAKSRMASISTSLVEMDFISSWVADGDVFEGCLRDCSDVLEGAWERPSPVFLELAQLVNRTKPIKKKVARNTILSNLPAIVWH